MASVDILAESDAPHLRSLSRLILLGEVKHWGEWGVATLISAAIFCGGFAVYPRLRPAFADVL